MADQTKPADRSEEAKKVADAAVPDAPKRGPGRPPNPPTTTETPSTENDRVTSREHPLSREPRERIQHADRALPDEATTHRPAPLDARAQERFEYLRSKEPNPNVLPPNVRTEAEEHEYRKLSKLVSDAARAAAEDAAAPEVRINPKHRLDELKRKGQHLGEGEAIEARRIEEMLRDEARIEELKKMDKRVPEEDDELVMLQQRVAQARAAGGFDPNG